MAVAVVDVVTDVVSDFPGKRSARREENAMPIVVRFGL